MYLLASDLTTRGSCLAILSPHVTLDLQGHTVTFATDPTAWTFKVRNEKVIRGKQPHGSDALARGDRGSHSRATSIQKISDTKDGPPGYQEGLDYSTTLAGHGCNWNGLSVDWCTKGREPAVGAAYYVDYTFTEAQSGVYSVAEYDALTRGNKSLIREQVAFTDFHLCCGRIVAGPEAPAFSSPIRLGNQGGAYAGNNSIEKLYLNVSGDSSAGIFGNALRNYQIADVTIDHQGLRVHDRDAEESMAVIAIDESTGVPNSYTNITVHGGPLGGLRSDIAGSKIHHNQLSLRTKYTNGFAIYGRADNLDIYENKIDCSQGDFFCRGILGQMRGGVIRGNVVRARDNNKNLEYGGCELGGAYAIQLDSSTSWQLISNDAYGYADLCDGKALRITDTDDSSQNISRSNHYTAIRIGTTSKKAAALSLSGARGFTSIGDTFTADSQVIHVDADGSDNVTLRDCKIAKGHNPAIDFTTIYIDHQPYGPAPLRKSGSLTLLDCQFGEGTSAGDFHIRPFRAHGTPFSLWVKWTVSVTVVSTTGPVDDARVEVTDRQGRTADLVKTDRSGRAPDMQLTQFRGYNTQEGQAREDFSPFQLKITRDGCKEVRQVLALHKNISLKVLLACP